MTLLYLPKHLTWVSHSVLLLFLLLMRFCGCSCYVDNVFLIRHPPTPTWLSRVVAYQSCLSLVCACAKTQIDVYLGKIDIHFPRFPGLRKHKHKLLNFYFPRRVHMCYTRRRCSAGRPSAHSLGSVDFIWRNVHDNKDDVSASGDEKEDVIPEKVFFPQFITPSCHMAKSPHFSSIADQPSMHWETSSPAPSARLAISVTASTLVSLSFCPCPCLCLCLWLESCAHICSSLLSLPFSHSKQNRRKECQRQRIFHWFSS